MGETKLSTWLSTLIAATCVFANYVHGDFCSSDDITVDTQADLDQLRNCSALLGSLTIGPSLINADLESISSLTGDLQSNGSISLQTISAPNLVSIGGSFILDSLPSLQYVKIPHLQSTGDLLWKNLPILQDGNISTAEALNVQRKLVIDGTNLTTLPKSLNLTDLKIFEIRNNLNLNTIQLSMETVTSSLVIAGNGANLFVSGSLVQANDVSFTNIAQLDLQSLKTVTGMFQIVGGSLTEVSISNLGMIGTGDNGGSLLISACPSLSRVSFDSLGAVVGNFEIENNTLLANIDGFGGLKDIIGDVDLRGNILSSKFPLLRQVTGNFSVDSTLGKVYNCTSDSATYANVVKGSIRCNDNTAFTSTALGTNTSTSTAANSSASGSISTSSDNGDGTFNKGTGVAVNNKPVASRITAGIVVAAIVIILILLSLIAAYVFYWKRRLRDRANARIHGVPELHGEDATIKELDSTTTLNELDGAKDSRELDGSWPVAELPGHDVRFELDGEDLKRRAETSINPGSSI